MMIALMAIVDFGLTAMLLESTFLLPGRLYLWRGPWGVRLKSFNFRTLQEDFSTDRQRFETAFFY